MWPRWGAGGFLTYRGTPAEVRPIGAAGVPLPSPKHLCAAPCQATRRNPASFLAPLTSFEHEGRGLLGFARHPLRLFRAQSQVAGRFSNARLCCITLLCSARSRVEGRAPEVVA